METIKRDGALRKRAQELRSNATKEEKHLWYDFLSFYPTKFRRQLAIDRFIVDFYCAEAKLVVELDGNDHYTDQGLAYDEERTAYLSAHDIEVIRFENKEVRNHFKNVCDVIDEKVVERLEYFEKEENKLNQ